MSSLYEETVAYIQSRAKNLTGPFAFLRNYKYDLKSDQLTHFGQQEMVNAGIAFYQRYENLAVQQEPFVRASGQDRVIESAENFLYGFYAAERALSDSGATSKRLATGVKYSDWYDVVHKVLVIPEDPKSNNTCVPSHFYVLT